MSAVVTLINFIFFLFFPWILLIDEQGAFVLWGGNTNSSRSDVLHGTLIKHLHL